MNNKRPKQLKIKTFKDKIKAQHHQLQKSQTNLNILQKLANSGTEQQFKQILINRSRTHKQSEFKVGANSVKQSNSQFGSSMSESIVIQSQFRQVINKPQKIVKELANYYVAVSTQEEQRKQEKNMIQTAKFKTYFQGQQAEQIHFQGKQGDQSEIFIKIDQIKQESQKQQKFKLGNSVSYKNNIVSRKNNYQSSKYVAIKNNQNNKLIKDDDISKTKQKAVVSSIGQKLDQLNLKMQNNSQFFSTMPIYSNVKSNREIPLKQKQTFQTINKNYKADDSVTKKKMPNHKDSLNDTYQLFSPQPTRKNKYQDHSDLQTRSHTKTPQPLTKTKTITNTEQKTTSQAEGGLMNFLFKIHPAKFEQDQDKGAKEQEGDSNLQESIQNLRTTNSILKLVANLGQNKSVQQIERLRNRMKNQKNLKLKDYLRLASLSNDAKLDKYGKSLNKTKKNLEVNNYSLKMQQLKKSSLFDKSRNPIDSQKSIALIQASLSKKLESAISASLKLFQQIQQDAGLVGNQYEDLVFMCNFHRVYDENMFKTLELLEDIYKEYEVKKIVNKAEKITLEEVQEIYSPRKKKRKDEGMPLDIFLIQKLLKGFRIIKNQQN